MGPVHSTFYPPALRIGRGDHLVVNLDYRIDTCFAPYGIRYPHTVSHVTADTTGAQSAEPEGPGAAGSGAGSGFREAGCAGTRSGHTVIVLVTSLSVTRTQGSASGPARLGSDKFDSLTRDDRETPPGSWWTACPAPGSPDRDPPPGSTWTACPAPGSLSQTPSPARVIWAGAQNLLCLIVSLIRDCRSLSRSLSRSYAASGRHCSGGMR